MMMVMVMDKVEKYMKLHRELLGSYDPLHLPVRPSQEALERMRGDNLNICSVKSVLTQSAIKTNSRDGSRISAKGESHLTCSSAAALHFS